MLVHCILEILILLSLKLISEPKGHHVLKAVRFYFFCYTQYIIASGVCSAMFYNTLFKVRYTIYRFA